MSQWRGTDSLPILLMANRRYQMASSSLQSAPFDARRGKRRASQWPLGLSVLVMTVANAALWYAIYALTHGVFALDPRFFAGL